MSLPQNALTTVESYLIKLQSDICNALLSLDPNSKFKKDPWQREEGGGGVSAIFEDGLVFEKAGVNFSHIEGSSLPVSANTERKELCNLPFHAMGVSLVIHPRNPFVPTTHLNVRFFLAKKTNGEHVWWFGGGFDLTPYYPFHEDCVHWHTIAREACLPFGEDIYPRFKKQCDDYFYLPHRDETRGIGGLFFDDLKEGGFENAFELMQSIGNHFIPAYMPIVEKRKDISFGEREKSFQCYRRGRYVEFNLIYDRGTLFGLMSKGRTESILMSLPPEVSFRYDWKPEPHSKEARLYTDFLKPRDWI